MQGVTKAPSRIDQIRLEESVAQRDREAAHERYIYKMVFDLKINWMVNVGSLMSGGAYTWNELLCKSVANKWTEISHHFCLYTIILVTVISRETRIVLFNLRKCENEWSVFISLWWAEDLEVWISDTNQLHASGFYCCFYHFSLCQVINFLLFFHNREIQSKMIMSQNWDELSLVSKLAMSHSSVGKCINR